jgi:ABC-type glycerol-3-phosphate transport system substrate-binding protein
MRRSNYGGLAGSGRLAITTGLVAANRDVLFVTCRDIGCHFVAPGAMTNNDLRRHRPSRRREVATRNKELRRARQVINANVTNKCHFVCDAKRLCLVAERTVFRALRTFVMSLAKFKATLLPAMILAISALALFTAGCPNGSPVADPSAATDAPPTVRLLVVDDAELATAIEREWKASGRGDLDIAQANAADLAETKRLSADVVIYPAAMLGDLAERHLIVPLPTAAIDDETFAQADIFPLLRRRECTWGEKVYAVPFGSPQLMLLVRKDLLEKIGATPPTTWTEYQELIASLAANQAEGWPALATVEPLAEGWGARLLLARAAVYSRHPNQYSALFDYQTMEPLIASPPYVRAIENLVAAQRASSGVSQPLTPAVCEQFLLDGNSAMAITWPTRKPSASAANESFSLGCIELPGARQQYDAGSNQWTDVAETSRVPLLGVSGRLGSITSSARHTRAASDALLWLAGKEKGPLIASQSVNCTLSRSSQVPQASRFISDRYDGAFANEYGAALEDANERRLSMEMPRIPGHEQYLAALDLAVQQAVSKEKTPAEALRQAAEAWRELTKKLGADQQKAAYMRSLGLEP